MATIKDVAKRAGVSIGSVSAVLNERAVTSPALRERVRAAIEELGYSPHAGARSLKGGRTRSIGLLVPDVINPHFAALASAIEQASERAGYTLSFANTLGDVGKEARNLELYRRQRVDGMIFDPAGVPTEDYMRQLRRVISVPAVMIDRNPQGLPFDSVLLNNRAAGRMVTEYLVRTGHRQIAILIGQLEFSTAVDRLQGYLDVLEESGIRRDERMILQGKFDIEPARKALGDLLAQGARPTAVVCINNQMTIGAMQALADQGFRCPEDISIAGIDDLPTASAFSPRLTAAAQPTSEIGEKAVGLLLARLDGTAPPEPVHLVCEPRLIVRSSCRVIGPGT